MRHFLSGRALDPIKNLDLCNFLKNLGINKHKSQTHQTYNLT